MRWKRALPLVALAGLIPVPASHGAVTPAEAIEIAKKQVFAQVPELSDPQVRITVKTTTSKVLRFVFSEPIPVNNETLWNIKTQYVWFGDPNDEFSTVGNQQGPKAAIGSAPGRIDPDAKGLSIQYLSHLNSTHFLNPGLRTVAAPVTVHMVCFHKKGTTAEKERFKAVGVDQDGRIFKPNNFSPLMPMQWPPLSFPK